MAAFLIVPVLKGTVHRVACQDLEVGQLGVERARQAGVPSVQLDGLFYIFACNGEVLLEAGGSEHGVQFIFCPH